MRSIFKITVLFGFFLGCTAASVGQGLSELVENADPAVFKILTYDEAGLFAGSGTGFYVDENGRALTNWHVLEYSHYAFAVNSANEVFPITGIYRASVDYDLAEFQVGIPEDAQLTSLVFDESDIRKGEEIFIIGCPEGYMNFVSKGLISAYYEYEGIQFYQTEASISSGSSGSPALNMRGEVCAVVTASNTSGQNLNFLTPIEFASEMSDDFPKSALKGLSTDHYVFHKRSAETPNLTLHSVECTDEKTTLYMSYSNTTLLYGEESFIYTVIDDQEQSFRLTNLENGDKVFALSSTIGDSPSDPTYLKLGETVFFKLVFPAIERNSHYSLTEGMLGGDWSFQTIALTDENLGIRVEDYSDIEELETLWQLLLTREDIEAMGLDYQFAHLDNQLSDRELSSFELNLAGVIAYKYGNDGTAYDYFMASADKSPLFSDPWINLYMLNPEGYPEEDLKYVNNALRASPDSPEYHNLRAEIHFDLGNYEEAVDDIKFFLDSDRTPVYSSFITLGFAQIALDNAGVGCVNFLTGLMMYYDSEYYDPDYADDVVSYLQATCDKKFLKDWGLK